MKHVAIVVATQYGQTTKIAERIAAVLQDRGLEVRILEIGKRTDIPNFDEIDAFVIGAPVYAGKFSRSLVRWVRENVARLNGLPTAFFSVSLNAADKRVEARKIDHALIRTFLDKTGLAPKITASLIGALHYREYNFFIRWILQKISKSANGPTDTSRDHELTDWVAVEAFASDFVQTLSPNAPTLQPTAVAS